MKNNLISTYGLYGYRLHLLFMKTFIFLLCTTAFAFSPNNGFSQDAPISINKDQALKLDEVFDLIQSQTDYLFIYRYDNIKDAPVIHVKEGVIKTSELLTMGLDRLGYTYKFFENTVIVSKKEKEPEPNVLQVNVPVTGVVQDSLDMPLAGVTVMVRGEQKAVATNLEGEFRMKSVALGSTLVFTHVGYLSKEVEIISAEFAKNLEITLQQNIGELEEVTLVSTGYQTISKERSAGSYSKPDMEVFRNRGFSMNVTDRLDGLVPGLTINKSPGAEINNPVLVRGLSSLSLNSSPLIVVDGVPVADVAPRTTSELALSGLLNINPQDIRDITVLKDATAASIWGARAANGVIVINTKKGSSTGDIEFQYDTFLTIEGRPDQDYLNTLNSREFIQVAEDIFDPTIRPYESVTAYGTGGSGIPPHERILYDRYRGVISEGTARRRLDSLSDIDNTGQISRLLYRPSVLTTHTLSVSAGKKGYTFYGSGNYTGTQSTTPGQKDDRYKLNLRQTFEIGERFNFDLITDITYQDRFSPNSINADSRFLPYQLFRDSNGNNIEMSYMTELNDSIRNAYEDAARLDLSYTPLDEVNYAYNENVTKSIRNVLGVNINIFDGLSLRGTYSYTANSVENENYVDHLAIGQRTEVAEFTVVDEPGADPQYLLPNTGGKYTVRNSDVEAWTIRNQLSYVKDWNNRMHQLNMIVGQESQEQLSISKTSEVRGYDDRLQSYEQIDYGALQQVPYVVKPNQLNRPDIGPQYVISSFTIADGRYFRRGETLTRFTSYYGNIAYTFNQKYSFNGSVRNDQSNLFGLDKSAQNKPVWSAGAKWDLGKESFLNGAAWLNSLALRGTYGIAGNAPSPGDAASFDILSPTGSFFFPTGIGLSISTPGNSKLSWERTATTNLGIDFNILGRISGSADYYHRKTTDLLGFVPTNPFTGYSSVYGNLGDLENKGFELGLQSRNLILQDFSWTSTLNIAFNENIITNLNLTQEITSGDARVTSPRPAEGYASFPLFAYDYAGLNENGDPQIRLADGTVTSDPNVATLDDIKFMGTTQPKWNGGFGNTFRYKNLSLNVNTVFSLGHVMRRDVNTFYSGTRLDSQNFSFNTGNINDEFLDRWREPGDEAFTDVPRHSPAPDSNREINYYTYGDNNVISGSFIKIRDINLIYRLPQNLFRGSGIELVTVRGQISNLLLWANNDYGIDPEYHFYQGRRSLRPGNRMTLGLNVKF
ncbi:SusC/RagA family TonB-linked outer membrane protein [Autumnicola musiva]|uniref:SusC/RagA family TonB-linked outer membrane protein n=1 Tax=Autumnicola musiva TaxID=3075589 RepID=A0ABU3D9E3_9FLAO|nr:SusC/RagA family TonB-linked outer membrane protein [Zunongwangia sp. F117]MDT0677960.1 SusC/RagA family TonB-linked outer membrane protein [Zunongwangia sp. F117]